MFCPSCGKQCEDNSTFCTNCGSRLAPAPQTPQPEPPFVQPEQAPSNPYPPAAPVYAPSAYAAAPFCGEAARLKGIFSSTLFLVLCIIYSASILVGLLGSSFDLLGILFCISLWITYAAAKDPAPNLKSSGLRFSSGVVKASWVLMWVGIGCMAVGGILAVVALAVGGLALGSSYESAFAGALGLGFGVILLVVLLIVIAVMVVVNIFFYGSLRKFCTSVISAAETGIPAYQKAYASRVWLMIVGILGCLSIFGIFSTAATSSILTDLTRQVDALRPYTRYVNKLAGAGTLGTIASVGKGVTAILASVLTGKVSR